MINEIIILLRREIEICFKNLSTAVSFCCFFCISLLIFIFSLGAGVLEIKGIYNSIIWVILIFSMMLISENFIIDDHNDGSLKELQFLGYPEELVVFCKSFVMWIMIIIPTILLIPIFSLFFDLSFSECLNLLISVFLASPSLTLISLVASLFSIQLRRNKIVQFIVVIPFYLPVIIFGTHANTLTLASDEAVNNFLILIGIFFITLPVCLIVSKLILKEINK